MATDVSKSNIEVVSVIATNARDATQKEIDIGKGVPVIDDARRRKLNTLALSGLKDNATTDLDLNSAEHPGRTLSDVSTTQINQQNSGSKIAGVKFSKDINLWSS